MDNDTKKVFAAIEEAGEPVRPGFVAKKIGMESKDVSKIIKQLKEDGKIMSPKNCFWTVA